ncbi:MAG TPA: hypothetical protein VNO75_03560 [Gemmatimonadaceae bacterium]|nr:hypothetical protein [Gemmatimonadaceae bacterium]
MTRHPVSLIALSLITIGSTAAAQGEDRIERWRQNCERNGNYDRERSCEVRNYTIARPSELVVDGRDNGSVSFYGSDRRDVEVVALIRADAPSESEAESLGRQVRIETGGGRIRADGPARVGRTSWSVSYHIYVPRQSNLEAETRNGGVSAEMVEGTMRFQAVNGGISLDQVGGDVRAETRNGGVHARLTGSTWKGRGLDLRTTNGGVSLTIPRGYSARLETGTTNGGMNIDFPVMVSGRIGRLIETQLGSGGPLVRAITTNGGVRITQR